LKKVIQSIFYSSLLIVAGGSVFGSINGTTQQTPKPTEKKDTTKLHFPVAKTYPSSVSEMNKKHPADLPTPKNLKTDIEYDPITRTYVIHTKVGDMDIATPMLMTESEYQKSSFNQSIQQYYKEKNAEETSKGRKSLSFLDMKFGLGPADKIFGPGGVQIKTQGSAEVSLGLKNNNIKNPSLPERSRNRTYFDFDEKIQLNVQAKVGDKVNFDLNYDTEATFDFDSKKIKLQYDGKEDEIIKHIEAGNVSMPASGSLIRGSQALFGVKTALQFGKLKATAVVSQQESESKVINTKGGVQTTPFEIKIDQYDENRHFFLAHYFRDNYDKWMSKLPFISSGIVINRLELWVTNKRGNYEQARNIIALSDLAEKSRISNSKWTSGTLQNPANASNSEYDFIRDAGIRDISQASQVLDPQDILGGRDYEKIESARKLDQSEFTINKQLGYVSLKSALQPDEVLAVSFEYTYAGKVYQVGEFSSDNTGSNGALIVKLLKNTSFSPDLPMWDLMMKNVYALNAYQIQPEKFKLNILYQSDTTGTYVNYIPEGNIKNKVLLKVLNLDRLDSKNEPYPDGFFDFIEGYTVSAQNGRIFFPVKEPFGTNLKAQIGDDNIAKKYVFQELYDSTLTIARQIAEKNKFVLEGEYKSSTGSEIRLNAMNVPRGSVKVTAGGAPLQENVDYSVDYAMGIVTILNSNILESGTPVSVSLENQSAYSMQRKTLLGLNLNYEFSENFNVGGTIMRLSEKPITQKVNMGDESISNTIWGLNTSYKTQFNWLTNLINKVPFIQATAPSQLSINAEFAQLKPGHPKELQQQGVSYLDDFESTKIGYSLREYYPWTLASTPYENSTTALFPEAAYSNDLRYGMNRAHFAWYQIDGIFTRNNSTLMPSHLKSDKNQRSNHFVREVLEQEIFPNKQAVYGESSVLPVLNLAYYPTERGPYNLDFTNIGNDGKLLNPQKRWGGMMRKLDITDFEASNFEYIEFWMMNPFVYDTLNTAKGGDLYFNLGEISEDILRDGKKSFENGFPIDGDTTLIESTNWGRVPRRQSLVYAFDNTTGARKRQDIGFDGLLNEDEKKYPSYKAYLSELTRRLSTSTIENMQADAFSPLNDPAGDNYRYYRGAELDANRVSILNRYKYFNGPEGNSAASEDSPEKFDVASKNVPDVEDINQDNTLNEFERYFQYKVSIRPNDTVVGQNYITDVRKTNVRLANGKTESITWYQFKIPLRSYEKKVGNIRDFKTIRFMRMFMTGFEEETILRFGTLELVRGEWRGYTQALNKPNTQPITDASVVVSAVNIEENADRKPVNYVLPPGVSRVIDPSQPQLRQLNEQALSIKTVKLSPADARAIYKTTSIDLRQYKKLQMNIHAERVTDSETQLNDGDLSVFIRLGSDYKNNYYEYEVPLKLTPEGSYTSNSNSDRQIVWPESNMMDISMTTLTNAKLKRNSEKRMANSSVTYQTPFTVTDPERPANRITVTGNPSLSEVKTIMIGIRNNSREVKSGEVWVNELRVNGFDEKGGWAATGNVNLSISDIATINLSGLTETVGFGGIEQSVSERRMDDYYQYNIATNVELGRLIPEKIKLKAPLYYSYSEQVSTPKYNPLDQDLLLKEELDNMRTQQEKDSLKAYAQDVMTVKSFSMSSIKFDIQSKNPMPYDPANFSFGYAYNESNKHNPNTAWEISRDYRGTFSYNYSPLMKPIEPFRKLKAKSMAVVKDFGFSILPNNIGFNTNMMRNYYEISPRDLNNPTMAFNKELLSWKKDFLWDRQFSMRWDFTKNIRFNINTATNARIDEPNVPLNKRLFPDEYEMWKDSVNMSLRKLGRPLTYAQTANLSWSIPLNKIKVLDWTSAEAKYNSSYNWNRGAMVADGTDMGNTIQNQMQLSLDSRLNMEQLYNKVKFLKDANRKFGNMSGNSGFKPTAIKRTFRQTITLRKDTTTTLFHNLNNKNIKVKARRADSTYITLDYKILNDNSIIIKNKGTQTLNIVIEQGPKPEDIPVYKIGQYVARGLMSVRNITIGYKKTNSLALPSFRPSVGPAFGQGDDRGFMAPGLDFAFGLTDDSYIQRAIDKDWLIRNDSLLSPAVYNVNEEFQIRANVEPLPGLKIELNANRATNNNSQIQFMYDGAPEIFGGSFTMTTIAISTSLKSVNSKNGYASAAFTQFLANRDIIAARIEEQYAASARYPMGGFMEGNIMAGKPYNSSNGGVNANSPDVLIPAFIAAYTGKDVKNAELTAFPSLKSLLPNWRITYDGLNQIPFIRENLKSVNLSHAYRCVYSVGSYSSYLNWMNGLNSADDMGFIRDVLTGNPTPSSPYDISSVSITESYSPLIGIDATLKNNLTIRGEYKDSRNLSLNLSANQIVEMLSSEFVLGLGYKLADFRIFEPSTKEKSEFKNDLTLRGDVSYRLNQALIRKIEDSFTQPTSGTKNIMFKFSADYAFSKALTLRAFLDKQINTPLVSSSSYPVSNTNFGISIRFTLSR